MLPSLALASPAAIINTWHCYVLRTLGHGQLFPGPAHTPHTPHNQYESQPDLFRA